MATFERKNRSSTFLLFGKIVIYLAAALSDFIGLLYVGFIRLFWGTKFKKQQGGLVTDLKKDSWFARKVFANWGGHTAAPHVYFYNHGRRAEEGFSPIEVHEGVHGSTFEAYTLRGFFMGLIYFVVLSSLGLWQAGLALWIIEWGLGHWLQSGFNWCQALLRGDHYYYDSSHEREAYSADHVYEQNELGIKSKVRVPSWWKK